MRGWGEVCANFAVRDFRQSPVRLLRVFSYVLYIEGNAWTYAETRADELLRFVSGTTFVISLEGIDENDAPAVERQHLALVNDGLG